ncbi:MAG: hypothetical protein P8H94_01230 [Crocinitomicaceae bacterium]|nr:hypothetical protein [Crocinitomicaceae bacterium]
MKEEKDHIDDFFKERSEQSSFEVPDSFLNDINSKLDVLDQKKKRRGGFFWLWTLIPIGLIMMYVLWPEDIEINKTKSIVSLENQETNAEGALMDSMDEQKSESILISDSLTEENITQEKPLNDTENRSAEKLKSLKNVLQADAKKIDMLADENTPLWLKEEIKKQEVFNSSNSNNESEIVPPEVEEMAIADSNPEKNIETRNSNINATENAEIEGSETDFAIDENVNNVVVSVDSLGNSESEDSIINNEAFEIDSVQIDSLPTETEDQDSTLNVEEVDPSETMLAGGNREKGDKINHEIQLYGGVLNSSSNLILSNDSSTFPMNTMESNLWSASFGVMYRAKIKQLDLGAGLSWMKTGEKANYGTNTLEMAEVDSLIFIGWQTDSVFNQNTETWSIDSIPLYDTTTVTTYTNGSIFYNTANKYTWISIPLRFGYRIDVNEFSFIPRVGIDLSFATGSNTGTYAEIINEGLTQNSSSRFILSYALQLEVRRSFDRWHVFVNPYFRTNVTPVISSAIQIRRYNSWGINAGIGFKLK